MRRHHIIITAADPLTGDLRQAFEAVATVAAWPSITEAEMSVEPISQRAAEHVAAFNHSVRSGDWATFADRFTSHATVRFAGVPAGPFNGREAIAAGYAAQPPSDTLTVSRAVSSGDVDELWFAWDHGGTGTMTLRWSAHLIAELTVTFA
jgi:steroid delta-isomerase